jgi:hypothetical protein
MLDAEIYLTGQVLRYECALALVMIPGTRERALILKGIIGINAGIP